MNFCTCQLKLNFVNERIFRVNILSYITKPICVYMLHHVCTSGRRKRKLFLKKAAALGQKCDAFTNQYIECLFAFEHGFFEYLIVWVLNIHPERNYYFIRVQWKNYRILFFLE